MPLDSNIEQIVYETKSTIEFVKNNWKDPIGDQYIYWLEQTLEKIKKMEHHREIIQLKIEKISLLCEKIASADDDPPKILKKIR